MLNLLFSVSLALLFVHEMDAVRCHEWNMFILLKNLSDASAYKIFAIAHIPLYSILLYFLCFSKTNATILLIDLFLILHAILHLGFRNNDQNEFNSALSKIVIYGMAFLAAVHMIISNRLLIFS